MKKVLLIISIFISFISFSYVDHSINDSIINTSDKNFSFELKATAVEQSLTIISNAKEPMLIMIVDKSGVIRIEKKLHLDRQIDLSILTKGAYVIRAYIGNYVEIKTFYKGTDSIDAL